MSDISRIYVYKGSKLIKTFTALDSNASGTYKEKAYKFAEENGGETSFVKKNPGNVEPEVKTESVNASPEDLAAVGVAVKEPKKRGRKAK